MRFRDEDYGTCYTFEPDIPTVTLAGPSTGKYNIHVHAIYLNKTFQWLLRWAHTLINIQYVSLVNILLNMCICICIIFEPDIPIANRNIYRKVCYNINYTSEPKGVCMQNMQYFNKIFLVLIWRSYSSTDKHKMHAIYLNHT
jgi:hypothetical protein